MGASLWTRPRVILALMPSPRLTYAPSFFCQGLQGVLIPLCTRLFALQMPMATRVMGLVRSHPIRTGREMRLSLLQEAAADGDALLDGQRIAHQV